MRIETGQHRHDSPLGELHLSAELPPSFIETLCAAMDRARVSPRDCYAAEVLGETGQFAFEVLDDPPIDPTTDELRWRIVVA